MSKEQRIFLKKEYSDVEIVCTVLSKAAKDIVEIDSDSMLDFMDFLEDESVFAMGDYYEATEKTVMLETIRDDIYYQTN